MAHPIINTNGTLLGRNKSLFSKYNSSINQIGVVEFYRIDSTIPFSDEDEEVSLISFFPIQLFIVLLTKTTP
jgi:hypothetical protein